MTVEKSIAQGFGKGELYDVLKWFDNMPVGATIVVGAEASDVINVTIQLTDYLGNDIAVAASIIAYTCTTSAGTTKETHTCSSEAAIGTDGDLEVILAKTTYHLISEADGDIDIDFTDTGTNSFYLAIVLPTGKIVVSDVITFAT